MHRAAVMLALLFQLLLPSSTTAFIVSPSTKPAAKQCSDPLYVRMIAQMPYDDRNNMGLLNPVVLTQLGVPEECMGSVMALHIQALELQEAKLENKQLKKMSQMSEEMSHLQEKKRQVQITLAEARANLRGAREFAFPKDGEVHLRDIMEQVLPRGKSVEELLEWIDGADACADLTVRVEQPLEKTPAHLPTLSPRSDSLRTARTRRS
jgi:hypothetical protein